MISITLDELSNKLTLKQLDKIPVNTGGIYLLYNANNDLIYIGRSNNLDSRIRAHINGKTHTAIFHKEIKYVRYLPTNSRIEQKVYELYAINTLSPKYNATDVYEDNEEPYLKSEEEINKERFAMYVINLLKVNRGIPIGMYTIREICSNNNVHLYSFFDNTVQKIFKDHQVKFHNQQFSL